MHNSIQKNKYFFLFNTFDNELSEQAYIYALERSQVSFVRDYAVHVIPFVNLCDQEDKPLAEIFQLFDMLDPAFMYLLVMCNPAISKIHIFILVCIFSIALYILQTRTEVNPNWVPIIVFSYIAANVTFISEYYPYVRRNLADPAVRSGINAFLQDYEYYKMGRVRKLKHIEDQLLNKTLAEFWYIVGLSAGIYKLESETLQERLKERLRNDHVYNNLTETMTCMISMDMITDPYSTWLGSTYDKNFLSRYLASQEYIDDLVDPATNLNLNSNLSIVPNKNVAGLLAYLLQNTENSYVSDYPGFLNQKTGRYFEQPLIFSNGLTIEADDDTIKLHCKNRMLAQLISQFKPQKCKYD